MADRATYHRISMSPPFLTKGDLDLMLAVKVPQLKPSQLPLLIQTAM